MNPKEKIKNDFIVILALGLFLNYAIYLWYGSLDIIDELIFTIPDRFYIEYDLQIQFVVLMGALIMLIAFAIEIIRLRHFSLILLTIVSIIQVIVAVREFLYWLNPEIYAGIDLVFVKIFLDLIQLCLLLVYLPRFRKWRGKGNRFIKSIFILIIIGIVAIFLFIFANFFIPVIYINTGVAGPVNLWLILVSCLIVTPGFIPIGILSFIQPASHTPKASAGIPPRSPQTDVLKCPKCGEINDFKDMYCQECGFEIQGIKM